MQSVVEQPATSTLADTKTHRNIARCLQQSLRARPDPSDVPELNDKMELLWGIKRNIFDGVPTDRPTDDDDQDLPEQEDSLMILDVSQAKTFLVENEEFQWLLKRMVIAANMETDETVDSDIREALIKVVGCETTYTLKLDWTPVQFANEQYERPSTLQLSEVICLSGVGSSIQVISCGDYVDRMWPCMGRAVLVGISEAMQSGFGIYQGECEVPSSLEIVSY